MKLNIVASKYRIVIVAIMIILGISSLNAELRWGPTAGVNFYDFHWKQKDILPTDATTGFNAGVMGEIMIPGIGFGVDFALKYNMHGAKMHFGDKQVWASDNYGTETCTLHTIQIPVNLRFKWTRMSGFEDYLAPFVFGGPVFNITVAHSDVKPLEYPRGCFGLQAGLGFELFKRFQISGSYYWGMTYELRTRKLDNFSAKPRGFSANVTYLF
ncbi:MAG: PorT family protein [Prevotella sp.]|nr:PorT family protein [Bacteroides sp.]MCM1366578.1 PorT family protein [Prevotella sp.]MCM1437247.1 PorT family protein [Prevotella sp.]